MKLFGKDNKEVSRDWLKTMYGEPALAEIEARAEKDGCCWNASLTFCAMTDEVARKANRKATGDVQT